MRISILTTALFLSFASLSAQSPDQESPWGTYRTDSPDLPTEKEAKDYGLKRTKQIIDQNQPDTFD